MTNRCYVGSTSQRYLCCRIQMHKGNYKQYLANNPKYRYCSSYDVLENDDIKCEVLEKLPIDSTKEQIQERERFHIENSENCVNRNIPRDKHQYYIDNNAILLQKAREYYEKNKEHKKQYYKDNKESIRAKVKCECGIEYWKSCKTQHLNSKKHEEAMQIKNAIPNIQLLNALTRKDNCNLETIEVM